MKSSGRLTQRTDPVIIGLALFNVIIHLVFAGNLEYQRDELLYFTLADHPDFGFATVPPLISWVAWIIRVIFGNSVFAVKLFPALMGGIIIFIVAGLTKELGGGRYARILAAAGMIGSLFGLRTFMLFQPVHIELVFWTLTLYLVVKYINSEDQKYLLWFGVVAGLSLLNKYMIGILFILLFIVVIFTRQRNVLGKRMFWYGIGLGALVFMPNLIWQIAHGLPVTEHLSMLADSQLTNVDRKAFLIEQVIIPGAASLLTIPGLIYLLSDRQHAKFRFLGVVFICVIAIFMILRGKSYYTQGIFPFLISAGAVFYEALFRKWYLRSVLLAIIIFISFLLLPFGMPVYKTEKMIRYFDNIEIKYGFDFGRTFEDGTKHSLPQDYADMIGWNELARITNEAWSMIDDKDAAFIYAENYGQAGAVTIIGGKYGLPEAVSFHESFKYWIPESFDPDIKTMVYINYSEPGDDVKQLFRTITRVGSISDPDAREYGTTVYLCQNPVSSFNNFWSERIKRLEP